MSQAFGCVILTRGDRLAELQRAVDSVTGQEGVDVDCLVVVNGGPETCAVRGARVLHLPDNLGIPAGRNRGLAAVEGALVLFLDDDAYLADRDMLARAARAFATDPALGVVSMRIADPDGRPGQRRHVPRLRSGDPTRSSDVTTFLGGACIIRRAVFDRVGLFPEDFFFGHEETSLAWRALDAGYRIYYDGTLVVHHPSVPPSHHAFHHYLTCRNRVWLARMHLPLVLAWTYGLVWLVLSVARARNLSACGQILRGYRDGLVQRSGCRRRAIRWRTIWRMVAVGRPPIV